METLIEPIRFTTAPIQEPDPCRLLCVIEVVLIVFDLQGRSVVRVVMVPALGLRLRRVRNSQAVCIGFLVAVFWGRHKGFGA